MLDSKNKNLEEQDIKKINICMEKFINDEILIETGKETHIIVEPEEYIFSE